MITNDGLKDYFERARRWEHNELRAALRSKRLAWSVALVAVLGLIVSVGAVAALAPLKSVEPFLVRVDNSTGIIDTVTSLRDAPEHMDEAVSRYFLAKYLRARESYSIDSIEHNFSVVSNMSSPRVQEEYAQWIASTNSESPQVTIGAKGAVFISIKAVQLIDRNLASIRYIKTERIERSEKTSHWIATIGHRSLPAAELSIQQRLINPLAFVVTDYRNDPEVEQ